MISNKTVVSFFLLIILFSLPFSCTSEYDRMVKSELASGVKNDSLFLGLHFGMTKDAFFKHCWELNKQKIISNGHQGTSVSYDIEMNETVNSLFFPKFNEDKIFEVPLDFQYKSWAPWNSAASADNLIMEVKKWLETRYGTGFIELDADNPKTEIWVKMDGNRRIIIKKGFNTVTALFSDMSVKMSQKTDTVMKEEEC